MPTSGRVSRGSLVHRQIGEPIGFTIELAPHVLEGDLADLRDSIARPW
jgi:hypothetical protein